MRFSFKKRLFVLLLAIVIAIGAFKIYRNIKTNSVVFHTLGSGHWLTRYHAFLNEPHTKGKIVFLGNSLTERFNLSILGDTAVINRGISGDFTEGVLKRMDDIISLQPSKLFIEIGVNDIFEKISLDEINKNYKKIIERVKKDSPGTQIYIQSNLPVLRVGNLTSCAELNKTIREQNKNLEKLAQKYNLTYINLYDHFLKDGALDPDLSVDGVHINNAGYEVWKSVLTPYLRQ